MTTEMVHIEGENGPGWSVPRQKPWEELNSAEQAERLLRTCGISCPGWCTGHEFQAHSEDLGDVVHTLDDMFVDGHLFFGLIQTDWLSPDGDLVRRDPAEINLGGLTDAPLAVALAIEQEAAAVGVPDVWHLHVDRPAHLAARLRPHRAGWAVRLAAALENAVERAGEPRRHGVRFVYGRGVA